MRCAVCCAHKRQGARAFLIKLPVEGRAFLPFILEAVFRINRLIIVYLGDKKPKSFIIIIKQAQRNMKNACVVSALKAKSADRRGGVHAFTQHQYRNHRSNAEILKQKAFLASAWRVIGQ